MATPQELVFAPLGGVGEIGMNLSIYGVGDERRRTWLAVDLGVSFAAEEHLPGVDLILPDIRYLVEERKNIAGLVLTHAHEDHFGALLDLWPRLKLPIYATPFTAALLDAKCASEPGAPKIPVKIVALGSRFNVGPFDIELVTMAHSIPESNALIIRTAGGTVLHTGDWKIDPTPILGDPTDEKKLRALGEEGCLALVGDSTNAVREGRSPSEADVAKTITELVKGAVGGWRLQRLPPMLRDCARSPMPPEPPTGKWWSLGVPWTGLCKSRARLAISKVCRISVPSMPTATCRRTRSWRFVPAARENRARRFRALPRTSTPR